MGEEVPMATRSNDKRATDADAHRALNAAVLADLLAEHPLPRLRTPTFKTGVTAGLDTRLWVVKFRDGKVK
jgi:hypothetical protein